MARPVPSIMAAYHVNIVQRNAPSGCAAKFNLGEGEVPVRGNRGLRLRGPSSYPPVEVRDERSSPVGRLAARQRCEPGRGDLSTPAPPAWRDCHPTSVRIALRFMRTDPPPQGEDGHRGRRASCACLSGRIPWMKRAAACGGGRIKVIAALGYLRGAGAVDLPVPAGDTNPFLRLSFRQPPASRVRLKPVG